MRRARCGFCGLSGLSLTVAICLGAGGGLLTPGRAAGDDGGGDPGQPAGGVADVAALSASGESSTDAGAPVCLAVMYTIQPGREQEAADDLHRLAIFTRKEAGNLLYVVHRSVDDPRHFLIYEQYRSMADLEAHRRMPYFQRYSVEGLQKIAESRVDGVFTPF